VPIFRRVLRYLEWVLSVGAVGLILAFAAGMCWLNSSLWAVLIVGAMVVFGLLVGFVVSQPHWLRTTVVTWVATVVVSAGIAAVLTATHSVVYHGIPPGPGETLDTRIGWFNWEFWSIFWTQMAWIALSALPYAAGLAIGWAISAKKKRLQRTGS